jgi:hypothetical protein
MTEMGPSVRVPAAKASGRYRFSQETIAGTLGNGRNAPIADLPAFIPERVSSSSRPEESHLRALPDPYVNLSIHTAPDVRPFP